MFPMTFYTADKIAEIAADPVCSIVFVACAVFDIGVAVGVIGYSIIDDIRNLIKTKKNNQGQFYKFCGYIKKERDSNDKDTRKTENRRNLSI